MGNGRYLRKRRKRCGIGCYFKPPLLKQSHPLSHTGKRKREIGWASRQKLFLPSSPKRLAGHSVVPCIDEQQVVAACEKHAFDVAVIGQAVPRKGQRHLASLIRQRCPSTKILELYVPYEGRTVEDADSWLEAPLEVPTDLAVRVTELANV
jgi:hypothetical protein